MGQWCGTAPAGTRPARCGEAATRARAPSRTAWFTAPARVPRRGAARARPPSTTSTRTGVVVPRGRLHGAQLRRVRDGARDATVRELLATAVRARLGRRSPPRSGPRTPTRTAGRASRRCATACRSATSRRSDETSSTRRWRAVGVAARRLPDPVGGRGVARAAARGPRARGLDVNATQPGVNNTPTEAAKRAAAGEPPRARARARLATRVARSAARSTRACASRTVVQRVDSPRAQRAPRPDQRQRAQRVVGIRRQRDPASTTDAAGRARVRRRRPAPTSRSRARARRRRARAPRRTARS